MYRFATMHSVADRRTDRQSDNNIMPIDRAVRSANKILQPRLLQMRWEGEGSPTFCRANWVIPPLLF